MRLLAIAIFLSALAVAGGARAQHGVAAGEVRIEQAWARATATRARNGAAYFTLVNTGRDVDRLVAVAAPVARKAELHAHAMKDGIMSMRRADGIEIHPGTPTVLRPGGTHVMLMGLKKPLRRGERFPLTLTFERGGSVAVTVAVQGIASIRPDTGGTQHQQHQPMRHKMN